MAKNLLSKRLDENKLRLLIELSSEFVPIPKEACRCGKPVVFLSGRKRFVCSRCGTRWRLIVSVEPVARNSAKENR